MTDPVKIYRSINVLQKDDCLIFDTNMYDMFMLHQVS